MATVAPTPSPTFGDGPANASTWFLVFSNLAFAVPAGLAVWRKDPVRAIVFAAIMVASGVYHYAHDTEHQPGREAWYNGFREADTWRLSKADTILSVWAACAGATLLVPLRHRTGDAVDGEVDRVVDFLVLFLGGAGVVATVEWAGYERCPNGFEDCSSDWLSLWYLLTTLGTIALELLWALLNGIDLDAAWQQRTRDWGYPRVAVWLFGIVSLTAAALVVYMLSIPRAWHGLWHILAAAAVSLALLWSSTQRYHTGTTSYRFKPLNKTLQ
jgi:hypothetical protein